MLLWFTTVTLKRSHWHRLRRRAAQWNWTCLSLGPEGIVPTCLDLNLEAQTAHSSERNRLALSRHSQRGEHHNWSALPLACEQEEEQLPGPEPEPRAGPPSLHLGRPKLQIPYWRLRVRVGDVRACLILFKWFFTGRAHNYIHCKAEGNRTLAIVGGTRNFPGSSQVQSVRHPLFFLFVCWNNRNFPRYSSPSGISELTHSSAHAVLM